jgi:hypothetical protein
VDVISQRRDARGEALRVCDDGAVHCSISLPTVIEVDVAITGLSQAGVNEGASGRADQVFVDVTEEMIPDSREEEGLGWRGRVRGE